jgi:hypothetical protein
MLKKPRLTSSLFISTILCGRTMTALKLLVSLGFAAPALGQGVEPPGGWSVYDKGESKSWLEAPLTNPACGTSTQTRYHVVQVGWSSETFADDDSPGSSDIKEAKAKALQQALDNAESLAFRDGESRQKLTPDKSLCDSRECGIFENCKGTDAIPGLDPRGPGLLSCEAPKFTARKGYLFWPFVPGTFFRASIRCYTFFKIVRSCSPCKSCFESTSDQTMSDQSAEAPDTSPQNPNDTDVEPREEH